MRANVRASFSGLGMLDSPKNPIPVGKRWRSWDRERIRGPWQESRAQLKKRKIQWPSSNWPARVFTWLSGLDLWILPGSCHQRLALSQRNRLQEGASHSSFSGFVFYFEICLQKNPQTSKTSSPVNEDRHLCRCFTRLTAEGAASPRGSFYVSD